MRTLFLLLEAYIALSLLVAFAHYMSTPDFARTLMEVLKILLPW